MGYPTIGAIRNFNDVRKALERIRAFFISGGDGSGSGGISTVTLSGAIRGSGGGSISTTLNPAGIDNVFSEDSGYLYKNGASDYTLSPFSWGEELTIAGGIVEVTDTGAQEYRITLTSESGVADQLDKIEGLGEGCKAILEAESGHTVTIAKGTYFKMPSNFALSGYRRIVLISTGGNICCELTRSANL